MADGGGERKASVGTPTVFISYASQDADAAQRISDALRSAGLEVWFDQSELRGGDAWDASIRRQIKERSSALSGPALPRSARVHYAVGGAARNDGHHPAAGCASAQRYVPIPLQPDTRAPDERPGPAPGRSPRGSPLARLDGVVVLV
jgi:hypothetical protein